MRHESINFVTLSPQFEVDKVAADSTGTYANTVNVMKTISLSIFSPLVKTQVIKMLDSSSCCDTHAQYHRLPHTDISLCILIPPAPSHGWPEFGQSLALAALQRCDIIHKLASLRLIDST